MPMKLGARMMKTGLAVAVAIYVASLFELTNEVIAAIAALFSIQPSIYRSFQTVIEQIQANIIAAAVAIITVYTLGDSPFIVGFSIIVVIALNMKLKMNENTIIFALVAVVVLMEPTDMAFLPYAGARIVSLMIGILSAFVVNLAFVPPKYETNLFRQIDRNTSDILQWLRVTTHHLSDEPALKTEMNRLQDEMRYIDQTYLLYKEERTYLRKKRFTKARKMVLFRQLIATTKKSYDVLKAFHRLEGDIDHIPKDFQEVLVSELDKVIHAHEKLMLSLMGRIRKTHKESLRESKTPDIPKLVEQLIHIYEDDHDHDKLIFLPLAAQLMEYHYHLEHLKRIIKSYQRFHYESHRSMFEQKQAR
ncbi:FUSC family protein [Thalassobacillus devorans]|nr:aromatic acid exporter family protein [Thalassobacillus devorans]